MLQEYTAVDVNTLIQEETQSSLDTMLREGARRMLQAALEMEVATYIEEYKGQVVRNGHHAPREVVSGAGPIPVRQPRVQDRRPAQHFSSTILPPYLRRTPSIDALIPALYLKGVSTSQFPQALEAIVGEGVCGLSPANIVRLKAIWEEEYLRWQKRDLTDKHYVYIWADGIYFNVRLTPDRPCVLVIIGATKDGRKELIAIEDGEREDTLSWKAVLQDLKARGLKQAPAVAIGDGALGFWAALREEYSATKEQRCWVHKTANVLDKLPKSQQPKAKDLIHQMYGADTEEEALDQYDQFMRLFEPKYPKACECLSTDKEALFTFYDFPAHHWRHLRTTNPIESTFGTVRHRTRQTKGCGSRKATLMMVYKLATEAEKKWQRLHGSKWLEKVIEGVPFVDGVMKKAA